MTALMVIVRAPDTLRPYMAVIADSNGARYVFADGEEPDPKFTAERPAAIASRLGVEPDHEEEWMSVALTGIGDVDLLPRVQYKTAEAAEAALEEAFAAAADLARPGVEYRAAQQAMSDAFDEWTEADPAAADAMMSGDEVDPAAMLRLVKLQQVDSHPDKPHRWLPEELDEEDCWLCGMPEDYKTHVEWANRSMSVSSED